MAAFVLHIEHLPILFCEPNSVLVVEVAGFERTGQAGLEVWQWLSYKLSSQKKPGHLS